MISYLTPEQALALHASGNAPMQIVDPTTQRVYYLIDSGLLAELERRSDLDAIREGIADMQAGRSVPIDQAKTTDRSTLVERFAR
jgi:predicted transcriptional regulator